MHNIHLEKIGKYSLLQISERIQRYQMVKICKWRVAGASAPRTVGNPYFKYWQKYANIRRDSKISYTEISVKICKHRLAGPSLRGTTIDLLCKYQKSPSPLGFPLVGIMDHWTMVDVAFILMTMIVMTMMLRMFASAKAT